MKNRILAMLCITVLCVTFIACGEQKQLVTVSPEPEKVEQPDNSGDPTAVDPASQFKYNLETLDYGTQDAGGQMVADFRFDLVKFEDGSMEDLNALLQAQCDRFVEELERCKSDYVLPDMEEGRLTSECPYVYTSEFADAYHNDTFISVVNTWTYFMGGVSNYGLNIVNYNYVNHTQATLADVLGTSKEEAKALAWGALNSFLEANNLTGDYSGNYSGVDDYTEDQYSFYLDEEGVHLFFSQYEILPGSFGCVEFLLYSWKDGVVSEYENVLGYEGEDTSSDKDNLAEGFYFTSLVSEEEKAMYEGMGVPASTQASFDGSILSFNGSFKKQDSADAPMYTDGIMLMVNDDATFYASGGEDGAEYMSREDFQMYIDLAQDTGLALTFEIRDGGVASIGICS